MENLTKEQSKLVEDNHKLIFLFLQQLLLPVDKYYDIAAIGLCRAAASYDKSAGFAFSTYAHTVVINELRREFRRERRRIPVTIYLDEPVNDENNLTIGDSISSSEDFVSTTIRRNYIDWIYSRCTKQECFILDCLQQGYTLTAIADILRCDYRTVKAKIIKIRKRLLQLEHNQPFRQHG